MPGHQADGSSEWLPQNHAPAHRLGLHPTQVPFFPGWQLQAADHRLLLPKAVTPIPLSFEPLRFPVFGDLFLRRHVHYSVRVWMDSQKPFVSEPMSVLVKLKMADHHWQLIYAGSMKQ